MITGSHDATIKLWDLRMGKTTSTLTYHKKSIRAMAMHPTQFAFASASADNLKKFQLPTGVFLHNFLAQQKAIVNSLALNPEGVLVSGADNGSLWFWDWKSGHCFQQAETLAQPGSLDSEAAVFASTFDATGSRLITCEADKTIKFWKEARGLSSSILRLLLQPNPTTRFQDLDATPETHPINFKPPKDMRRY